MTLIAGLVKDGIAPGILLLVPHVLKTGVEI